MGSSGQGSPEETRELANALDRLWERFLPEIRQRVAALESAAAAAAVGSLKKEQQAAAHETAHKLAGVLGTFGLADGTTQAREAELLYAPEATPGPEHAEQLASLARGLRALIENRKRTQAQAN